MLKVVTIVGTRPELIKMSRVIAEFDKHTNHILVHTGQNFDYELNEIFFEELSIRRPDYYLEAVGITPAQTIGRVIEKADELMRALSPDAVLLYGDTNSCLAVISAKRLKIPVFHMEAGNRSFDQRVPEEINRKILDHLSDINLVLTEQARSNLLLEGINPQTIIKTGSHMKEVLDFYADKINDSFVLNQLGLQEGSYFLVSIHREENVDELINLKKLVLALNSLALKYDIPVIVSTHPRTQKLLSRVECEPISPLIRFLKPFGFFDYIQLQRNALCVVSDSGTISEEAYLLNLPAITIRHSHERPEGMDAGVLIMCGLETEKLLDAVSLTIQQHDGQKDRRQKLDDYEVSSVSNKILNVVMSYTDYINRTVWFK